MTTLREAAQALADATDDLYIARDLLPYVIALRAALHLPEPGDAGGLLALADAWEREAEVLNRMVASGEDMAARDAYEECARALREALPIPAAPVPAAPAPEVPASCCGHESCCAVHDGPALQPGPCSCGNASTPCVGEAPAESEVGWIVQAANERYMVRVRITVEPAPVGRCDGECGSEAECTCPDPRLMLDAEAKPAESEPSFAYKMELVRAARALGAEQMREAARRVMEEEARRQAKQGHVSRAKRASALASEIASLPAPVEPEETHR